MALPDPGRGCQEAASHLAQPPNITGCTSTLTFPTPKPPVKAEDGISHGARLEGGWVGPGVPAGGEVGLWEPVLDR